MDQRAQDHEERRHGEPTAGAGKKRNASWTELSLVVVLMGTIGVMAVPKPRAQELDNREVVEAQRLTHALIEFRDAILDYHVDHGVYPGYRPSVDRRVDPLGPISARDFVLQLEGWSDDLGRATRIWNSNFEHGPYLMYGIPVNPVNGSKEVLLLPDSFEFPVNPTGDAGWLFKPATGELRANCAGTVAGSDETYYSL